MSITPGQRQQWREDAEYGDAVNAPELADDRILALLDELDAAERERDAHCPTKSDRCCLVCGTHVNPHRGCMLR